MVSANGERGCVSVASVFSRIGAMPGGGKNFTSLHFTSLLLKLIAGQVTSRVDGHVCSYNQGNSMCSGTCSSVSNYCCVDGQGVCETWNVRAMDKHAREHWPQH
jgi:hypothetical protein